MAFSPRHTHGIEPNHNIFRSHLVSPFEDTCTATLVCQQLAKARNNGTMYVQYRPSFCGNLVGNTFSLVRNAHGTVGRIGTIGAIGTIGTVGTIGTIGTIGT